MILFFFIIVLLYMCDICCIYVYIYPSTLGTIPRNYNAFGNSGTAFKIKYNAYLVNMYNHDITKTQKLSKSLALLHSLLNTTL